jgi:RNA polymerase sigma factor for flagellar operon FliA
VIPPGVKRLIHLPNEPEDNPHSVEMRHRLTDAILQLPDRERLVFTLCYYEELTKGEVGLLMGEAEPSVSELYVSALSHLNACFKGPRELHLLS